MALKFVHSISFIFKNSVMFIGISSYIFLIMSVVESNKYKMMSVKRSIFLCDIYFYYSERCVCSLLADYSVLHPGK